ncbi:tryptophan-rich sensory protein [Microterricola viridarii]|uniref:TspO and MBR related proteins n=1 Tax=Microterricola viridarii TaxID=412690 RepID=A0A1H1Y6Y2_9MICO|nr:tryptophan-rich sensory protein [Microterricola viridarii]SDT17203.1 hypothetical protein SAMN04489834_2995 [Microterricola viridarii]
MTDHSRPELADAEPHSTTPAHGGPGDLVRQLTVAASAVIAVAGSFIGSGAAGGTPIQDAAGGALAADATLIAPGTGAFSIWSLIYLGLLVYAVWQFLPGQKRAARQRKLGYLVAASLLLNAAWILSVQFDLLWLSVPVIIVLLVVLARAFVVTIQNPPTSAVDGIVTDGTIGLYLGWVCVATAANIAAVLVAAGFDGWGIGAEVWAMAVLALAGVVGILLAVYGGGRIAPTLSLVWGLTWVGVARLSAEPFSGATAIGAFVTAGAVVIVTAVARVHAQRTPLSARLREARGGRV